MGDLGFFGKYSNDGLNIQIGLDIIRFTEDGITFMYAPALDITGYGENEVKARQSFELTMEEFLKYTLNKGTFRKELERLGWRVKGRKNNQKFIPPYFDKLFQERDYLAEIFREKDFTKQNEEVAIPIPA